MATSIRDLIRALESEAPYGAGADSQSQDAAGALCELGRGLRLLSADGLELDVGGHRESIARDLAESCVQNAATIRPEPPGRLTSLAGGAADFVAVLRFEIGRDQRWAIAIELASAARVLSTYAAEGDARRTADLAWTHLTARALITHALQDSPSVQSRAVLDRAMPRMSLPPGLSPAQTAAESLIVISDRLRRSTAGLGRRPTLLEVFAVTRAAESTIRHATTTAAVLDGVPLPDARPTVAIWSEVRDGLRPFTTAAPLRLEDRDLGMLAQRAHNGLRREFGDAQTPEIMATGRRKVEAVRSLQVMVNEVPAIADNLATAIEHLADHGDLHALARRLPFREQRLEQFLAKRAVVADRFDVAPIMDRLSDAAKLAAELATTLNRAAGTTPRSSRPVALAARIDHTAERPDPHAPLVQQLDDGIQTSVRGETPEHDAAIQQSELMLIDDADYSAGPELGIE